MKKIFSTITLHLTLFFRIKQAVFYNIAFPVFIFVVFGSIFGLDNEQYVFDIFTGVIGMTIVSTGLFAIGKVLKEYYVNGWLKYLKKLPIKPIVYFTGIIISRFLTFFLLYIVLFIFSYLFFNRGIEIPEFINIFIATFLGFFIFSFLGLCLSFSHLRFKSEYSLTNITYYIILFTSSAFYPICGFNESVCYISNILPLNPILELMRNGIFKPVLIVWVILSMVVFIFLTKSLKFNR